jgi:hypothetical protein
MRKEYDFSAAHRGPVLRLPPGKTRITIRIDDDILKWFRRQVHAAGGGNYQTSMNAALREYIERRDHKNEDSLRVLIREELGQYEINKSPAGHKDGQRGRRRTTY